MGYAGVVRASIRVGERIRRGTITKTGNAHLRRILVEAAWAYRHRPYLACELLAAAAEERERKSEGDLLEAQHRLHSRYARLMGRLQDQALAMTAVARELPASSGPSVSEVEGAARLAPCDAAA